MPQEKMAPVPPAVSGDAPTAPGLSGSAPSPAKAGLGHPASIPIAWSEAEIDVMEHAFLLPRGFHLSPLVRTECVEAAYRLASAGFLQIDRVSSHPRVILTASGTDAFREWLARGIEARRAETPQGGSVHESPVAEGDAPNNTGRAALSQVTP